MSFRKALVLAAALAASVTIRAETVPAVEAAEKVATPSPFTRTEEREPCSNYTPLRRPHFGDLHVHTAFSQDASTQGTRNRPRDAYRFARGREIGIQPYDADGAPYAPPDLTRHDFTWSLLVKRFALYAVPGLGALLWLATL